MENTTERERTGAIARHKRVIRARSERINIASLFGTPTRSEKPPEAKPMTSRKLAVGARQWREIARRTEDEDGDGDGEARCSLTR
jgi:hypothetical protein